MATRPPFLNAIGDVHRWATRFKDARVAAAHHQNRHPAETGRSDYYFAETGYFLFVLCMLRHIEADDRAFERIGNDDHLESTGRHLQLTD